MPATYDNLATTTLSSANSTITFSSISSAYTDLKIVMSNVFSQNSATQIYLRVNSNSTNYSTFTLWSGSSTNGTSNLTNGTEFRTNNQANLRTTNPLFLTVDIFDYANTGIFKTMLSIVAQNDNYTSNDRLTINSGIWRNTSAISSLSLFTDTGEMTVGTTATLYGIARA